MPERVQLRRIRGYRKPPAAIVVARPSVWGNPFKPGMLIEDPGRDGIPPQPHSGNLADGAKGEGRIGDVKYWFRVRQVWDRADAVALYVDWAARIREQESGLTYAGMARRDLAGRDLACWCPLPAPGDPDICHAAQLIRLAAGQRPMTPDVTEPGGARRIALKRCCNGCGEQLGDVTDDEIAAGYIGDELPDVRSECPRCSKELAHA